MIKAVNTIRLFLLLLSVTLSTASYGQKYSVGVRAGGSLTWPGFGDKEAKEEFNRRLKPGFHAGVLLGFPLKDKYEVILEGGLSQKGRIITFNDNEWQNNLTLRMTDISMLLRRSFTFMLKKDTPVDAFFNIGPEINYWFGAKGKLVVEGVDYPYSLKVNEEPTGDYHKMYLNNVNQWLFGIGVGVGMKAPLGRNQHLTTELRFLSGHTFLGKKDSAYMEVLGFSDTFKTNLKTASISVAYSIDMDIKARRMGKSTIKKRMKRQ